MMIECFLSVFPIVNNIVYCKTFSKEIYINKNKNEKRVHILKME